jgi:hypothetical protein
VWGLAAKRMDERLVGRAIDEDIDYVSVGDVGSSLHFLEKH